MHGKSLSFMELKYMYKKIQNWTPVLSYPLALSLAWGIAGKSSLLSLQVPSF